MATISRSVLYLDKILLALRQTVNTWQDEMGEDLTQVRLPVADVVRDLLASIDIPDDGVRLVLGARTVDAMGDQAAGEEYQLPCCVTGCANPAHGLYASPAGIGPRLLCEHDARLSNARIIWQVEYAERPVV